VQSILPIECLLIRQSSFHCLKRSKIYLTNLRCPAADVQATLIHHRLTEKIRSFDFSLKLGISLGIRRCHKNCLLDQLHITPQEYRYTFNSMAKQSNETFASRLKLLYLNIIFTVEAMMKISIACYPCWFLIVCKSNLPSIPDCNTH
jgi:hypothetical protein